MLSICMQNQRQNEANFFPLGIQILPVAVRSISWIRKQWHIILHLYMLHLYPSTGMHVPLKAACILSALPHHPWHCCQRQITVPYKGKRFRKRCSSCSI